MTALQLVGVSAAAVLAICAVCLTITAVARLGRPLITAAVVAVAVGGTAAVVVWSASIDTPARAPKEQIWPGLDCNERVGGIVGVAEVIDPSGCST